MLRLSIAARYFIFRAFPELKAHYIIHLSPIPHLRCPYPPSCSQVSGTSSNVTYKEAQFWRRILYVSINSSGASLTTTQFYLIMMWVQFFNINIGSGLRKSAGNYARYTHCHDPCPARGETSRKEPR